jgi:hypothetical protein
MDFYHGASLAVRLQYQTFINTLKLMKQIALVIQRLH